MDKKIAGLLGAVAALGTAASVEAAPLPPAPTALQASSYADLLAPIPNAGAVLQAMDEQGAGSETARVELARYHHHHHRTIVIRRHRHHHHHHYHHHHR